MSYDGGFPIDASDGGTGASTLTGILSGNGTSAFTATPAKLIIQEVRTSSTATDSSSATYAFTTVPTASGGKQLFTLAITPTNASNILKISGSIVGDTSTTASLIIALFQDSTADALAVWANSAPSSNISTVAFSYYMAAGTTSSTTFKIRYASNSGTAYINQNSASAAFGGSVIFSSLYIQELQV